MATEYTVQSVTVDAIPSSAILFSSLTPIVGTLPTFSSAPVVWIIQQDTNRPLYIDPSDVTTSQFQVRGWDDYTDVPPYTVTVRILVTGQSAVGASSADPVNFPWYCSLDDVKDVLTQYDETIVAAGNLDENKLRRFISQAYGRINSALARGSYQVPAVNTTKQTMSGSLSASANVVTINQVSDGSAFTEGDTVRIHGPSGSGYNDEFTSVVAISGNLVDVLWLNNSYDADSTIEVVIEGMETLRHLNAQGAALLATGALTLGYSDASNDKEDNLTDAFSKGCQDIQSGALRLPGLSKNNVTTYIEQNASQLWNQGAPVFKTGMAL